jgi:HEAT repeat protein
LEHDDERVRVRAIEFLGWSRDPRAVEALSQILEAKASQYPAGHALSDAAAEALGRISRKETLPVLERAAAHGVQRAIEAVGALGNDRSFETMLAALRKNPERCAHIDFALYWLVRRSNKVVEPWMSESSTTQAIQIARVPQWRAWWERHKDDFRIICSQEEAVLSNPVKQ